MIFADAREVDVVNGLSPCSTNFIPSLSFLACLVLNVTFHVSERTQCCFKSPDLQLESYSLPLSDVMCYSKL